MYLVERIFIHSRASSQVFCRYDGIWLTRYMFTHAVTVPDCHDRCIPIHDLDELQSCIKKNAIGPWQDVKKFFRNINAHVHHYDLP